MAVGDINQQYEQLGDEAEREYWESQPVEVPWLIRLMRRLCKRAANPIDIDAQMEYNPDHD